MKRITISLLGILAGIAAYSTNDITNILHNEAVLLRNGGELTVDADFDLKDLKLKSTESLIITPSLAGESDTLQLPSVGIYGKRNYIFYIRNYGQPLSGQGEKAYQAKDAPDSLHYNYEVKYEPWMDGAQLQLSCMTFGCCNRLLAESDTVAGHYEEFHPIFMYEEPTSVAQKTHELSGTAYIDFPVNKTAIYPEYRNNIKELGRIRNTIDSVKDDADITITSIWLKGYASPESPYSHNERLASGRVLTIKNYLQEIYNFPDSLITTAYEPEDWTGLRKLVAASTLENRDTLLAIIDMDMDPDAKEAKIKKSFPKDYRFMLETWYPSLRHTDYKIEYEVRAFYDPAEIAQVMSTTPQKLTLNELYVLGNYYEPGSDAYNEVFDTAAKLFPNDTTPNLNAALNAMRRNDLESAEKYMAKAGDSPQADYAKGLLSVLKQDYEHGLEYLQKAADAGVPEAETALENLRNHLHINSHE